MFILSYVCRKINNRTGPRAPKRNTPYFLYGVSDLFGSFILLAYYMKFYSAAWITSFE